MKKILMLGTGGTIACVPSDDGLVPALDGASLLRLAPGLSGMCSIECRQILNLDSSNLEPGHWQLLARTLASAYDACDGFVITHGTDTMAYTAAALSQMLRGCRKPVVLTGAQLPMQAAGSDAPANILHAFMAACSSLQGVALVFGNKIIHGSHAKKLYTEDFNGFESINCPPLALIEGDRISWRSDAPCGGGCTGGSFAADTELETRVAVVKLIPGASPAILDFYLQQGCRGLIIEGFGAGGVPNAGSSWLPALERLLRAGVTVVCASQCLYDGVRLDKYPIGVLAERLGAKSAGLDTLETAVARLMRQLAK